MVIMPLNRIAADHSPLNSVVLAYKLNHFSVHIKPDDFIFFKGIKPKTPHIVGFGIDKVTKISNYLFAVNNRPAVTTSFRF